MPKVHSILTLDKKVVGVRFNSNGNFLDVEIQALAGVTKEHLLRYKDKIQTLIPHGDLLVTEEELDNNFIVEDATSNWHFCTLAAIFLKTGDTLKPIIDVEPRNPEWFWKWRVTLTTPIYYPEERDFRPRRFDVEIEGKFKDRDELVKTLQEEYAYEFDTEVSDIKIISVVEIESLGNGIVRKKASNKTGRPDEDTEIITPEEKNQMPKSPSYHTGKKKAKTPL